jgi:hypothetical protein
VNFYLFNRSERKLKKSQNTYIPLIIVGGGPCGLTLANMLRGRSTFKILIPNNPQITMYSQIQSRNLYNIKGGLPSSLALKWGNQHDTNIYRNFSFLNTLGSLPGFPFNIEFLKNGLHLFDSVGWPKPLIQDKSKESLLGFRRNFIVKLKSEKIQKKLRFNIKDDVIKFNTIQLKSKNRAGKYIISLDGKLISCSKIIFATGGLSNTYFANEVTRHFYPNLKLDMIGKGYTNHPKAQLLEIEFKNFVRYMRVFFGYKKIFSWYRIYPEGMFSFRLFPIFSYKNKVLLFMESIFIKFGYGRKFVVMAYMEYPQCRNNSLKPIYKNGYLIGFKYSLKNSDKSFQKFLRASTKEAIEVCKKISRLKSHKVYDFNLSKIKDDQFHYFGTTRMGSNSSNSVVNKYGKMHHTKGIYFIGTSVLPISRSEHPTYIAMLLSAKTAFKLID